MYIVKDKQTHHVTNDTAKNQTLNKYSDKAIQTEKDATWQVLKFLKSEGYSWGNIRYINKNRYCIVHGNPNIAILQKKEKFHSFGKIFNKEGEGDSINVKHLIQFIRRRVKMIYIQFQNGELYVIPIKEFLKKSIKYTNHKEAKTVRCIAISDYNRIH